MAAEGKNRRPESTSFRIWPGVMLIAVCAFLVFLAVYVFAYRTNLIPLPEYLRGLFEQNGSEQTAEPGETELYAGLMPEQAMADGIYYNPAGEDPYTILSALQNPEKYRHRMRITRSLGDTREVLAAEVFVMEDCWKLTVTPENAAAEVYLCNGTDLYRKNSIFPAGSVMKTGAFTPENLLGLPTLADLQQAEAEVQVYASEKVLQASYKLSDGIDCICRIGLDSGLLMEVQLQRSGETILMMYTELFDLAPEEFLHNDFFTIPKTEE